MRHHRNSIGRPISLINSIGPTVDRAQRWDTGAQNSQRPGSEARDVGKAVRAQV